MEKELTLATEESNKQQLKSLISQSHIYKRFLQLFSIIRKTEFLSACKSKTMPLPVTTPPILAADLRRLSIRLNNLDLQLAIPIEQLSRYYKLPIADCAISKDVLVVHLKIPITQKFNCWQLYKLLTTPFGWENDTCVLMHEPK